MGKVSTGSLLLVLAVFAVTAIVVVRLDRPVRLAVCAPLPALPARIGRWKNTGNIGFGERVLALLGTRDVQGVVYEDRTGRRIQVVIVRSAGNRAAFHPPEYCLTGAGHVLLQRAERRFPLKERGGAVAVNEMVFSAGERRKMLVWNWYVAGSRTTANYYRQQLQLVKNRVFAGNGNGAAVTLYSVAESDALPEAVAACHEFLGALLPLVHSRL